MLFTILSVIVFVFWIWQSKQLQQKHLASIEGQKVQIKELEGNSELLESKKVELTATMVKLVNANNSLKGDKLEAMKQVC